MIKNKEILGFIFDMDGTMVDNMMMHHRGWQKILSEYGLYLTIEEVMATCHGKNEEILEKLFPNRFSKDERYNIAFEKEKRYRDIFAEELKLVSGLERFLNDAHSRNIPLSIGTAAPPENVNFVLDSLNIRHIFNTVIDASQVNLGKPDPQVFQKAAQGMNVPLDNLLIFEDSPTGAETAFRAGCPVVIITTTHQKEEFIKFPNVIQFIENYESIKPADFI